MWRRVGVLDLPCSDTPGHRSNYKRKWKSNKYPGDIKMFYLVVRRTARVLDRTNDYAMATGEQHLLRYRNAQKF